MASGIANTFENDLLLLIFNATAIANIADNASSSPLTTLQVSLHTADIGETGNQTTNEIAYTSYARVARNRNGSSGGWSVSANSVSPHTTDIDFPAGTGGSGTASDFGIGTASSSTGKVLFYGDLSPSITCGNGVTPRITAAGTTITID